VIRIRSQKIRDKPQIPDLWDKIVIDTESNLKKYKRNQLWTSHFYTNSLKIWLKFNQARIQTPNSTRCQALRLLIQLGDKKIWPINRDDHTRYKKKFSKLLRLKFRILCRKLILD